jgi:hypothetical protein
MPAAIAVRHFQTLFASNAAAGLCQAECTPIVQRKWRYTHAIAILRQPIPAVNV